jgi:hypothetical protein
MESTVRRALVRVDFHAIHLHGLPMTKPVLVRSDGTLGPTALKMVEDMAAAHQTQRTIAAALDISIKDFEKMLASKSSPEARLAWERGFAKVEQSADDHMRFAAFSDLVQVREWTEGGEPALDEHGQQRMVWVRGPVSKTSTIAAIYYTKARLGWSDTKVAANLNQDNRIQITLPAPMGFGEMLHGLGQTEIRDFRKDKTVPIRDITPKVAREALMPPAPAKEESK